MNARLKYVYSYITNHMPLVLSYWLFVPRLSCRGEQFTSLNLNE